MESLQATLATYWFGAQTSTEAHNRPSCPRLADTALKTLNLSSLMQIHIHEHDAQSWCCAWACCWYTVL